MRTLQKKALKKLFELSNENSTPSEILLLEIGPDHCTSAELDLNKTTISTLQYFSHPETELEDSVRELIDSKRSGKYSAVVVGIALPAAVLVPSVLATEGAGLVRVLYDIPQSRPFADVLPEWQVSTSFLVPESIIRTVTDVFPEARFIHRYTAGVRNSGSAPGDEIQIHFTPENFMVIVKKGAALQLVQTYGYQTGLDVAYFLLKICEELGMSQEAVELRLSGLVEEASALYRELHQFFLHIRFTEASSISIPESELPVHFFSSTYKLAACVS